MKHPILFGGLLGGTFITSLVLMAIFFPVGTFFDKPLSTIMNLPNIMPFFTIIGTIMGIFLGLFIYGAFKEFDGATKRINWMIIIGATLGFLMIWIPYNDIQTTLKLAHTIAGIGLVIMLIILAYEFNKISQITSKTLSWMKEKLPPAMGIGTFGIMIVSGINLLMEAYFFTLAFIWLLIVGIVIKKHKK